MRFALNVRISVGDWLVMADNSDRILLYSVSSGQLKARFFGRAPLLSPNGELLSVTGNRGERAVYHLHTLKRCDQFAFLAISAWILFPPTESDCWF